jgi:hypothetical protein
MKRAGWVAIAAAAFAGAASGEDAGFQGLRVEPYRGPSASGFGFRLGAADPMRAGVAGIQRDLTEADAWSGLSGMSAARGPASSMSAGRPFAYPSEASALMDYRLNRWTFSSSLRQGLGERSTAVDVGARYGFSLAPRHSLALLGSVGLGNHSAIRPLAMDELDLLRLRPPGLGFRDVGAQFSVLYTFDQTWYVNTMLGYSRLLGDPADLGTPDRNVTSVGAFFGFRF